MPPSVPLREPSGGRGMYTFFSAYFRKISPKDSPEPCSIPLYVACRYIQGGPQKSKPLPNYPKIVLNRIKACQ